MKNLYVILFGGLLVMSACNTPSNDQAGTAPEDNKSDTQKTLYAVPLDSVKTNINRYLTVSKKVLKTSTPVKSFTIRSVDLLEAMGMPSDTKTEYEHVRIYLGLDKDDGFKLYLTPVDGARLSANPPEAGEDVILKGKYDGLGDEEGEFMLDFSSPCPKTCPDDFWLSN